MKTARSTRAGRPAGSRTGAPLALAAALLALALPGLATAAGELFVAAAASLREPLEAIAADSRRGAPEQPSRDRDVPLRLGFGASSALAAQIRMGAPVDVLLSADPAIVEDLAARGHVDLASRVDFAGNRLVVIRSARSGLAMQGPRDLARESVHTLALPGAAVPLGRYARDWLAHHQLLAALAKRILLTEDPRASLAAVDAGNADAAIVYETDLRAARSAQVAWRIPDTEQPRILYTGVRTRHARNPQAADRFLARLRSPAVQAQLQAAGFLPAPEVSTPETEAATPETARPAQESAP